MNKHQQWEENRDLGQELLASVKQMKAGQAANEHKVIVSQAVEARLATGLSQATFARLIGVSKRTLQEWEQGRRTPNGAAAALLKIAVSHPDVLRELQTA
ncbi:MAG: helix-turn-helix domain-containing protein [Mariprofundaceae bacterium]|nr:helix-turn-helix domain-containing protein [Mariprofundaceae bacterium]